MTTWALKWLQLAKVGSVGYNWLQLATVGYSSLQLATVVSVYVNFASSCLSLKLPHFAHPLPSSTIRLTIRF